MLTEECGMNDYLFGKGYDIIESDLGERILQWMKLHPSHIVMPAIHIKRQEVGEMMERVLGTEKGNSDPTYLTHAVRKNMREKFLTAEVEYSRFRHGEDRAGSGLVRCLHPPAGTLRHGAADHFLHFSLL